MVFGSSMTATSFHPKPARQTWRQYDTIRCVELTPSPASGNQCRDNQGETAMARKSDDIVGLRLRMPAELHRLLVEAAERNNRSLNSEILWCVAQQLGGDAPQLVEDAAAEHRRAIHNVFRTLIPDQEKAAQAIARFEERQKPPTPLRRRKLTGS
jgi:hypothetical protein